MTPATDAADRAREVAALFYDKRDPLDQSYRDVAHNIRRGRLDDQDAVELVRFALAFADTEAASQPREGDGHIDDMAVDRFAAQMKAKLAAARTKGRGGWDDPEQCSPEELSAMLHEHVAKGDPIDVANFCMMLAHYGVAIVSAPGGKQAAGSDEPCSCILSDPDGEPVGGACPACIAALATKAKKADDDSGIILPLLSEEQLAEIQQIADRYNRAALTQRPPEQAGAVPAGVVDLAEVDAVILEMINVAVNDGEEGSLETDFDRGDVDRWQARLQQATGHKNGFPSRATLSAAPTPPDAGTGEIPAGMVDALKPFLHAAEPILHNDRERWQPDEWTKRTSLITVGQFRTLHAAFTASKASAETDAAIDPRIIKWFGEAADRAKKHGGTEGIWLFGSQWRDVIAALTPKASPQTPPDAGIGSDGAGERV